MKYQFIEDNRSSFKVERMCRAFRIAKSGFYSWRKQKKRLRTEENERLVQKIREIDRKKKGRYGSPRIADELKDLGYSCSENRVARLMKKNSIAAKMKKLFKVTTKSNHKYPISPNLLGGKFESIGPNKIFASDITYIWTGEGWLYLAVVLDVYSRSIVGWSMGPRLTSDLVTNALLKAIWARKITSYCIFHSDQGVQYASHAVRDLLRKYNFIQSMSGKGCCYDNAIVETFFHTLKTELVYFEYYPTRESAKKSIFEYIEIFYNRERKHSSLNYQTPEDFENLGKVA